jgi:hypothetical protein
MHTGRRFAHDFQPSVCTRLCNNIVIQNHENEHVRSIGQGEARRRKHGRLKFGGGQAYDRSND